MIINGKLFTKTSDRIINLKKYILKTIIIIVFSSHTKTILLMKILVLFSWALNKGLKRRSFTEATFPGVNVPKEGTQQLALAASLKAALL